MLTMNFNTTNSTFRQLLGNGLRYHVPPFQRDYSWSEVEWDELWQDIEALFSEDAESAHYMGYLVLQTTNNKQFDIIDGQQRLTTLSIMILAGLSLLKDLVNNDIDALRNEQRLQQLKSNYIGYTDPVTLIEKPMLQLNRHNDKYYRNHLITLDKLPQRGLHASEHRIRKAFNWFQIKLKQKFGMENDSGQNFAQFLDELVDKLFFTVITVNDELNAFKVFETLNARGVRLSSTDLLKNYLFSLASVDDPHDSQIKHLEERWESIIRLLGSESFPEFLRVYWNSSHKLIRKTDLFKTIRKHIRNKSEAFELVKQIELSADAYTALKDTQDARWVEESKYLKQLSMYRVKQPFSVLLASYEKFFESDRAGFLSIVRAISILSFRYNVICNNPPNEQERFYNNIAIKIDSNQLGSAQSIIKALDEIYPNDEVFKSAFSVKQLKTTDNRNKKIVRYILCEFESKASQVAIDEDNDKFNIEHILPENPDESWGSIDDSKIDGLTYRLGNMILLEANKNRVVGNQSYQEKVKIYNTSSLHMPQRLNQHYNEWSQDSIESRQKQLAKLASSIWKISELS
ncbi:DUF262 domain-containing protein [Psychrobacter frigidicola]|uniref:DUF262 domain-containing protein n=2 Tax=Psychrobacter frigidicola TaxID=45611 RepID=A0A5C7A0Y6_9GAMM|nr:DUF262 domain-containing protein [Psychrobacter frigidicola]